MAETPPRHPGTPSGWQRALRVAARGVNRGVVVPLVRLWRSDDPIDAYALNHMMSVAGDALLAISLADSVFFSLPVDESRLRVAAYLGLTMLPLALAGPLIVPILDRAGPRRSVTAVAAVGRATVALLLAPRLGTLFLFPLALLILMQSKVHTIVKNGLTMAYATHEDGLLRANARLGRLAVVGAIAAAPFGFVFLKAFGGAGPIYLAAVVWAFSALLTLRLPHPGTESSRAGPGVAARGRLPELGPSALGAVGMRSAGGFLLFLLAFSLRSAEVPGMWFAVLAVAGVTGGFLADVVAPKLRRDTREEAVVIACVSAAGIGALLAFQLFGLPLLTVYALTAGAATEFARLAFQSLMQRHAPAGALGRVFVRYEVLFQVAWVVGAFVPALVSISFHTGILLLALFYGVLAGVYWWRHQNGEPAVRDTWH